MTTCEPLIDASAPTGRPVRATMLFVFVHLLAWLLFVGYVFFAVPGYKEVFVQFNVRVSWSVIQVIDLSDFLHGPGLPLAVLGGLVLLAIDGLVIFAMRRTRGGRLVGWLWFLLLLGLPLYAFVLSFAVMHGTWRELAEGLSR